MKRRHRKINTVPRQLSKIYYDPKHPASFSNVDKLWLATNKKISKKKIKEWLSGQETYTRHKPIRRKFRRSCYFLENLDSFWETDLLIMPNDYAEHNDGVKYVLVVIDCFSKFLFVAPLKRKTTEAIIEGFKVIFSKTNRRCQRLASDKGGEYVSKKFKKFMKDNDIIYNTTNNDDIKCAISERVIKTVKHRLFKYLYHANSFRYIDVLDDIVDAYNNSYHRTIKMTPNEVNERNILQVYENIKDSCKVPAKKKRPKLKVGDHVRISKYKNVFAKGYEANFSEEIFVIKAIVKRDPIVYKLVDLLGEDLTGTFYENEVVKVKYEKAPLKVIEAVIKERRIGRTTQYLVKWRNWPAKFNSWVSSKDIKTI